MDVEKNKKERKEGRKGKERKKKEKGKGKKKKRKKKWKRKEILLIFAQCCAALGTNRFRCIKVVE